MHILLTRCYCFSLRFDYFFLCSSCLLDKEMRTLGYDASSAHDKWSFWASPTKQSCYWMLFPEFLLDQLFVRILLKIWYGKQKTHTDGRLAYGWSYTESFQHYSMLVMREKKNRKLMLNINFIRVFLFMYTCDEVIHALSCFLFLNCCWVDDTFIRCHGKFHMS